MASFERASGVLAGLFGAAGVAASAAASHAYPGTNLDTAGTMMIMHAAALLALGSRGLGASLVRRIAASAMAAGLLLFAGDLVMRAVAEQALFPMAAPFGGLLLIASWLVASLSFLGRRDG